MSLYILDTDHLTLFQKSHPLIGQRMATIPADSLAVTVITAEEQLRGWFKVIRRFHSSPKLVWAYAGLRAAMDYFHTVQVLDFDEAAYTRYQALRQQKIRIGPQDLRIAAISLSVNGILVTRNQRDFDLVPDLSTQDWTIPQIIRKISMAFRRK